MAAVLEPVSRAGRNGESGWVNRLFTTEKSTANYQELKFTLHRKLLDRINLDALSSLAGDRVRAQVRTSVAKLVEEEKTPLSLVEKDRIIEEILDEVFGLGPLEPLLQDPSISDILVTTLYRRGTIAIRPSAWRLRMASRIVARLTPNSAARLASTRRVSAGISLLRMRCRSALPTASGSETWSSIRPSLMVRRRPSL